MGYIFGGLGKVVQAVKKPLAGVFNKKSEGNEESERAGE